MIVKQVGTLLPVMAASVVLAFAADNQNAKVTKQKGDATRTLALVNELTIKSQAAGSFMQPIKCNGDGNAYLLTSPAPSDGIRKFSRKGQLMARFTADSASDMPVQLVFYYSVARTGEVYQIAFLRDVVKRAVLIFGKDGSYKSGVTLDNPPGAIEWAPSQVAAFSSGDLLVTGLVHDYEKHISTPFTGIFSSNGQLQKQVLLSDDDATQKMLESGDPHVVRADHPYSNSAVEFGQMDVGSDGNIHLLRNLSPSIIYVVSPAGEVVRRFTVETGGFTSSMHMSDRRIALLYDEGDNQNSAVKVVDLDGHPVATYQRIKDGHGEFGSALACYTGDPDRFIFLGPSDDGFLQFKIVELNERFGRVPRVYGYCS